MSDSPTIQVMYTCKVCHAYKVNVSVPAREEGENIVAWLNRIMEYVGRDHSKLHCPNNKVDLMIPVLDENQPIGSEQPTEPRGR